MVSGENPRRTLTIESFAQTPTLTSISPHLQRRHQGSCDEAKVLLDCATGLMAGRTLFLMFTLLPTIYVSLVPASNL